MPEVANCPYKKANAFRQRNNDPTVLCLHNDWVNKAGNTFKNQVCVHLDSLWLRTRFLNQGGMSQQLRQVAKQYTCFRGMIKK